MTRWFPRVHRGVVITVLACLLGVITNGIHKNDVSSAVISVTLIALAVWGGVMLARESERKDRESSRGSRDGSRDSSASRTRSE